MLLWFCCNDHFVCQLNLIGNGKYLTYFVLRYRFGGAERVINHSAIIYALKESWLHLIKSIFIILFMWFYLPKDLISPHLYNTCDLLPPLFITYGLIIIIAV